MRFAKVAFSPLVKKLRELYGSRVQYARMERSGDSQDRLGDFERELLGEHDTFYWATTSSTGWPYIQHRGGPKGFLKVIDDRTLAFVDFRGNRQYITTGNLMSDDRVKLSRLEIESENLRKELAELRSR